MASVATDLARQGFQVTGSDSQFYPPMSELLAQSQVKVFRGFAPSNLPDTGLIVVGNAVSRGNVELEEALNRNLPLISLPELIRIHYLPGRRSLVVAGTHGKTTTSSLAAHVFRSLGGNPGWMIGGDPVDLPNSCEMGTGDLFVIEGDEYDTAWFDKRPKFLLYRPYYAILTSIEFDHSDIYRNIDEIEFVFRRLAGLLPERGVLVCNGDDPLVMKAAGVARCKVVTYGVGSNCSWQLTGKTEPGDPGASGSVQTPEGKSLEIHLTLPGSHNLCNATAVLAMAVEMGVEEKDVLRAIESFTGVARRLQKVADNGGIVVYDDFAHHPTAIRVTLSAVKKRHPVAKIWAVFEPRSNTMVRNYLQNELEEALSIADKVVLAPLHRIEKIPVDQRLDLNSIQFSLNNKGIETIILNNPDQAADSLKGRLQNGDVVVMMSNGSFGGATEKIARYVEGL